MGRPRKSGKHLPNRVYAKGDTYYYVAHDGKWLKLGKTEADMYRNLAKILDGRFVPTMNELFERYAREIIPTKAPKTAREDLRKLEYLRPVFGKSQPDAIKPKHVARYLDERTAKIAANREKALLSHVFTKAIRWGYATENPCSQVENNKEKADNRYITDEEFVAVYRRAPAYIRDAMAIALLTGQRQADVLKLQRPQLLESGVLFRQGKTGKELIVKWSPSLRKVIERALSRPSTVKSINFIIHNSRGHAYSSSGFQTGWQRHMRKCAEEGVIESRFTFRAIRAKARSDGTDERLLGHSNPQAMAGIYQRKPDVVRPVK